MAVINNAKVTSLILDKLKDPNSALQDVSEKALGILANQG